MQFQAQPTASTMNLHSCSPFPPLSMANKAGSAILYLTLAAPAGPKTRIEFYGYRLCLANQNGAHGRRGQGGSKVRPVAGTSCSAALKSEDRRPKPESRPKSEFREWPDLIGGCSARVAIDSDFGLRISFGLRSSGLGFGMARTDFRAVLPPGGTS